MKRFTREYHDNKVNYLLGGRIKRNPAFRLENDGIITENPEFNKAFQNLVIAALRSPYNTGDVKSMLQDLQDDFQQTFMFSHNIRQYGRRGVFAEYLRGLPTVINLPYRYSEMAEFLIAITRETEIRKVDPAEVDFFFSAHVEYAIHTLLKEHGLPAMDSLDILD